MELTDPVLGKLVVSLSQRVLTEVQAIVVLYPINIKGRVSLQQKSCVKSGCKDA
jgi:hypothetical protein